MSNTTKNNIYSEPLKPILSDSAKLSKAYIPVISDCIFCTFVRDTYGYKI